MKKYVISAVTALLALLLCGCVYSTLEYDQLSMPQVKLDKNEAGNVLRISGTNNFHSGLDIKCIRQIKEGSVLAVEVVLSPFQSDWQSSSFETEVYIDDFDFVVFGKGRTLLWRRYPGTTPDKPVKPVFVREDK